MHTLTAPRVQMSLFCSISPFSINCELIGFQSYSICDTCEIFGQFLACIPNHMRHGKHLRLLGEERFCLLWTHLLSEGFPSDPDMTVLKYSEFCWFRRYLFFTLYHWLLLEEFTVSNCCKIYYFL